MAKSRRTGTFRTAGDENDRTRFAVSTGRSDAERRSVPRRRLPDLGRPLGDAPRDRGRAADPQHQVFAVAQRDDGESVSPSELYTIGTIATLGSVQRGLGGVRLVLEGKSRGIAMRYAPNKMATSRRRSRRRASCSRSIRATPRSSASTARCASAPRSSARSAACPTRPSSRCSRRSTSPAGSRTSSPATSTFRVRAPGPARDARDRGPAAPRADPRPAPDRRAVRAGGHPVQGQGGARRPPARGLPARAAAGDPEGARRGRRAPATRRSRSSSQARRAAAARGGAQGGRARVAAAPAHRPRVDGVAGHPHVPRDDRGAAVGHAHRRAARRRRRPRGSSTRTTTASAT